MKKTFNNLADSIITLILLVVFIGMYVGAIYLLTINILISNLTLGIILVTLFLGSGIIFFSVLLIVFGFEYWIISDNYILTKNLFKKPKVIYFADIKSVSRKKTFALKYEVFYSEAYFISDGNNLIKILINDKNELYLRQKINMLTQHHK